MKNDHTTKVREMIPVIENLNRLHSEMELKLFSAEIACEISTGDFRCLGKECNFKREGECVLPELRKLLGEHRVLGQIQG